MRRVFFVMLLGLLVVLGLGLTIPITRDEIHWRWVSYRHSMINYESYILSWPQGRHVDEAKVHYNEHAWMDAQADNSIQGFEQYVKLHQNGKHVAEAKANIESLHWQKVITTNSIQGFMQYIKLHPDGKHVAEAKASIESLRLQNATALSIDGKLEGEKGGSEHGDQWEGAYGGSCGDYPWRSNASGTKSVHLSKGGKLRWHFATNENKAYAISLRYSNDGDSDTIAVFIGSKIVGKCINSPSHFSGWGYERYGIGWNLFQDCEIGNASLLPGRHNLSLEMLNSDRYGVEVDYVKLEGVEQTPARQR